MNATRITVRVPCSFPHKLRADRICYKTWQRVNKWSCWCAELVIESQYIQPEKPDQNTFIERFNQTYSTEVLNAHVFESMDQVREISAMEVFEDLLTLHRLKELTLLPKALMSTNQIESVFPFVRHCECT